MTTGSPSRVATFAFDDLAVGVESTDASHVLWLREFLEPDFRVVVTDEVACRVAVVAEDERFDAVVGTGPSPDAPLLDCFALDSSVVRLPIVAQGAGETTVVDEQFGAAYVIDLPSRRVTIVTRRGHSRVRASLLRVVREFAMNHAHGSGLFLHASSLAVGDAGVVIAGSKAAGKTTLLTYLLANGAGAYHSNDRVLARDAAGDIELRNMPTVISVRPRTLDLVPQFGRRLEGSGFVSYLVTLEEAESRKGAPFYRNHLGNYVLSPAQYRTLLGAPQRPVCRAAVLVFPVISEDVETFRLEPLSPGEALRRLPGAFLGAGSWRKGTESFTLPATHAAPDEDELHERAAHFADRVRTVEIRLGPAAFRGPELAEAVAALAR